MGSYATGPAAGTVSARACELVVWAMVMRVGVGVSERVQGLGSVNPWFKRGGRWQTLLLAFRAETNTVTVHAKNSPNSLFSFTFWPGPTQLCADPRYTRQC